MSELLPQLDVAVSDALLRPSLVTLEFATGDQTELAIINTNAQTSKTSLTVSGRFLGLLATEAWAVVSKWNWNAEVAKTRLLSATRALLIVNADNHTAHNRRKELIELGELGEVEELAFLDFLFTRHPKSSESWSHRRWVLERLRARTPDAPDEMADVLRREHAACIRASAQHPKNYLSWNHRGWLLVNFPLRPVALGVQIGLLRKFLREHPDDSAATHYLETALLARPVDKHDWHKELSTNAMDLISSDHEVSWRHRRFLWDRVLAADSHALLDFSGPSTCWLCTRRARGTNGEEFFTPRSDDVWTIQAEKHFCDHLMETCGGLWAKRHLAWLVRLLIVRGARLRGESEDAVTPVAAFLEQDSSLKHTIEG